MNYEAFISSVTVILYIRVLWYLLCYCEDPLSISVPTFILKQVLPALPSDTSIDCRQWSQRWLRAVLVCVLHAASPNASPVSVCWFLFLWCSAVGLDVFAIGWEKVLDGENEHSGKKAVILYISTVPIYTLFIILIYCKVLGCRADFKA